MASISPQHVQPLTMGYVGLLVFSILVIGALNHAANRKGI
jgi:hypothetical protein